MISAARGLRLPALALALAAAAAGVLAGLLAASGSDWVRLDVSPSPEMAIAGLAGALALLGMALRPAVGVGLLLALAFTNASEILVREHGMPSVLQLLVPLLLVVLATSPRRPAPIAARSGFRPDHAFLLASSAWLAVLLASTTWARNRETADDTLVTTLKAVLLAVVVAYAIRDAAALAGSAWVLLGSGATLAAISSYQVLTERWGDSFGGFARVKQAHIAGTDLGPRATGPLADPNFYAQALLPLVPLALALALRARSLAGRLAALALGAVVSAGIVTTYSRGGALALFLVLGLSAWQERSRIRAVHVVAVVAALAVTASFLPTSFFVRRLETLSVLLPGTEGGLERHDSSVMKRRVLMAAAASMAVDHPLLGVGAGNYGDFFEEHADRVGAEARIYHDPGERAFAHSLYLEIAAENGVVGLLAIGAAVACGIAAAVLAARRFRALGDAGGDALSRAILIGLLGVLASSLILHGDYPRYLWLQLGLCVAAWRVSARAGAADGAAA